MKTIELDTVGSTNTFLKDNYRDLEDLTFVSALLQTAGRGRNNRQWIAEKGQNLTFSLLLKDEFFFENYRILSVLSAYSVVETLKDFGVENPAIKWPNDVWVNEQKICGILLESVIAERMECLIIGIGINVNQEKFAGDYLHLPTSLYVQINKKTDPDTFRKAVYGNIIRNLDLLKKGHDFHEEIEEYDYLKGKKVFAEIKGERKEVTVLSMDSDYSLKINCEGKITNIDSGEITFHLM